MAARLPHASQPPHSAHLAHAHPRVQPARAHTHQHSACAQATHAPPPPHPQKIGSGGTGKLTTWEGGHRVPGIASWPGRIPAGTVTNALASTLDLVPTVASIVGFPLPTDRVYDGVDLSPVLFATPSDAPHRGVGVWRDSPDLVSAAAGAVPYSGASAGAAAGPLLGGHTMLFHPDTRNGNITAVRMGQYKAMFEAIPALPCNGSSSGRAVFDPPIIFDLSADPAESTPLSPPPPGLVAQFRTAFAAMWTNITSTMQSTPDYSGGGTAASPCCNGDHVVCRCTG
jgi:hypothetical protein